MWPYALYLVDVIWNLCTVHLTSTMAMTHPLGVGTNSKCRIHRTHLRSLYIVYALMIRLWFCVHGTWFIDRLKCFDWIEGSWKLKKLLQQKCNLPIEIVYSFVRKLNYVLQRTLDVACTLYTSFRIKINEFRNLKLFILVTDWFFTIICCSLLALRLFRRPNPVFIDRRQRISIAIQNTRVNRSAKM